MCKCMCGNGRELSVLSQNLRNGQIEMGSFSVLKFCEQIDLRAHRCVCDCDSYVCFGGR